MLIRKREMVASDEPVHLATSYFPWALAEQAGVTETDTGPGGTYSRLAEIGKGPGAVQRRPARAQSHRGRVTFFRSRRDQQVYEIVHISYLADGTAIE